MNTFVKNINNMKVFVHIATENEFMDRAVEVAVECDGAPRIGDSFHITDNDQYALVRAIIDSGSLPEYDCWIFGRKGKYYFSIEDCIYVSDALWRPSEGGVYEYHICLNATQGQSSDPPDSYLGKRFLIEDYDQIIADFNKGSDHE